MKYEKMRGKSISECLMKIRSKYGSQALVIAQREIREGGVLGSGLLSRKMYEVDFMIKESSVKSNAAYRKETEEARVSHPVADKAIPGGTLRDSEVFHQLIEHRYGSLPEKGDRRRKNPINDLVPDSTGNRKRSSLRSELDEYKKERPVIDKKEPFKVIQPEYSPEELIALLRPMDGEELDSEIIANINEYMADDVAPPEMAGPVIRNTVDDRRDEVAELAESPEELPRDRTEKREITGIRINDLDTRALIEIRKQLIGAQLSQEFTESFLSTLNRNLSPVEKEQFAKVEQKSLENLSRMIRTTPDIAPPRGQCKAVMLIGPYGSGKTTSLGKLAVRYYMKEKREVSVYSLDRHRIAATEQLKSFAQVMEVPFYAPLTPEEFRETIDRDGAELMLIDTPGIGPGEMERMHELIKYIDACPVELEKHLVLGADMNPALLEKTMSAFDRAGFEKIILTRLDETEFIGAFIEHADKLNRPFSYLMNGQYPAGEITDSKPMDIAKMILRQ